jgi:hypothetical protein
MFKETYETYLNVTRELFDNVQFFSQRPVYKGKSYFAKLIN